VYETTIITRLTTSSDFHSFIERTHLQMNSSDQCFLHAAKSKKKTETIFYLMSWDQHESVAPHIYLMRWFLIKPILLSFCHELNRMDNIVVKIGFRFTNSMKRSSWRRARAKAKQVSKRWFRGDSMTSRTCPSDLYVPSSLRTVDAATGLWRPKHQFLGVGYKKGSESHQLAL
jgi:hypothetical protein